MHVYRDSSPLASLAISNYKMNYWERGIFNILLNDKRDFIKNMFYGVRFYHNVFLLEHSQKEGIGFGLIEIVVPRS